jgi:predicted alternative tryptophan synthase beta-subunit
MAPQVSLLKDQGIIEAVAVPQSRTFDAGRLFTQAELILPAPEPTHAISVVIDEVTKAREAGTSPTILFNLCGHGHFDATSYTRYLDGELEDYELPQERIEHALETVPSV